MSVRSSLVEQWVKNLMLSLWGVGSIPGPGSCTCHKHGQKEKEKKKKVSFLKLVETSL